MHYNIIVFFCSPLAIWHYLLVSVSRFKQNHSIFSCKYKSSKPSIVEYIYHVKKNFILKNNFQLLRERRKLLKKVEKKLFRKGIYLTQLSFFSLLFFNPMWTDRKNKKNILLRNILFSNLTINLLINFVSFFIKSISSVFKNLCLCYVCKKQINTITKKIQKCNNNNNNNYYYYYNLITYIAQVFIKMIKCALQTTNLFTISKTIKIYTLPP